MEYFSNYKQIQDEILQLIRTGADVEKIWPELAAKLVHIFKVDTCLIIPWLNGTASVPIGFCAKEGTKLLMCEQIALNALKLKIESQVQPWVIFGEEIRKIDEFIFKMNLSTCLVISTKIEGNTNGIILLGHLKAQEWTTAEKEIVKIVSSLVALIISIIEWQSKQMMSSTPLSTSIMNFTRENFGNSDINSSLNFTLAGIAQVVQAHRGLVLRLKYTQPIFNNRISESCPQGEAEVVAHWSEYSEESLLNRSFKLLDSPICQEAWEKAPQPIVITDSEDLLKITNIEDTYSIFKFDRNQALIIAPLLNNYHTDSLLARVLGFLIIQCPEPRFWQDKEIDLVKWAGIQAGMTIIHEQTLQRVQSMVDERNARLKWMLEFQSKLNEKRQQDLEKMRRLNQIKDQFIDNLSDTLRHPLTKIKMAIEMLKLASNDQQRQRYMAILESECTREINLVNDLLTLQKLKTEQFKSQNQRVNLKDITDELNLYFKQQWAVKSLNLEIEYKSKTSQLIYTDPENIKRILNELLTNAGKFSAPNTTIYLVVNHLVNSEQNNIIITVADTGVGISKEEQQQIFEPFRRGANSSNGSNQGTGIGLAIVKSLVEHLNGTIEVKSENCKDSSLFLTSFTVTIPMFSSQQQ